MIRLMLTRKKARVIAALLSDMMIMWPKKTCNVKNEFKLTLKYQNATYIEGNVLLFARLNFFMFLGFWGFGVLGFWKRSNMTFILE